MLSGDTYERDVPGEPGEQFTFRHLAAPEVDEADLSGSARLGKELETLPQSLVGKVMDSGTDKPADDVARREQQFRGYDPNVLVKYGIVAWTYKRDGQLVPCTPETIVTLIWRTRNWAAQTIFDEDVRALGELNGSGTKLAEDGSLQSSAQPIASSPPE